MLYNKSFIIMSVKILIKSCHGKMVNTRKYLRKSRYVKLVSHVAQSKFFRRTAIVSVVLVGTYFIFPKPVKAGIDWIYPWVVMEGPNGIAKRGPQAILDYVKKLSKCLILPNEKKFDPSLLPLEFSFYFYK
jgi:hypothetical protein